MRNNTQKGFTRSVVLIALLLVGTMGFAKSRDNHGHPLSPELEALVADLNNNDTVEVIIQFKDAPNASTEAKVFRQGGLKKSNLKLVDGGLYTISVKNLNKLAKLDDVVYITPNRKTEMSADFTAQTVFADQVQKSLGFDGTGVGVAIVDSGVAANLDDLKKSSTGLLGAVITSSRVVYSQSFLPGADGLD